MHNIHERMLENEAGLGGIRANGVLETLRARGLSPAVKVRFLYYHTMTQAIRNMIGMCHLPPFDTNMVTDIVRAFTADDDSIPDRFFEPFTSGPLKGVAHDRKEFRHAKELYYQFAGPDKESGKPIKN